jgi:hypothetical protein
MKLTAEKKAAIWEGIKNGIRNVWFSIIPVILTGIDVETGEFSIKWMVVIAVSVVSVITTVDGIMHEWGKVTKNATLTDGLSLGV